MTKLDQLVKDSGFNDSLELGESVLLDVVSPGICMNQGCSYSTEVEPDQTRGYCESCDTNTVRSAMVLMGVI